MIWEHGALVNLSSGGGSGLGEPLDENDERIRPTLIVRSRGFAAVHRYQVRIVAQKIGFDAHQSSYEWRAENWIYLEVEAPHPIGIDPVGALLERTDKQIAKSSRAAPGGAGSPSSLGDVLCLGAEANDVVEASPSLPSPAARAFRTRLLLQRLASPVRLCRATGR